MKKEVTFEESRRIQLDILLDFVDFCMRNGLRYSLGEGTLIGAIRHKGFIPWDDDIDVLMLREEYDKFVSLYDGKYRLVSPGAPHYWLPYSRLTDERTVVKWGDNPYDIFRHGLWVTVFPIDNYPDNPNEWQEIRSKRDFWFKIIPMKLGLCRRYKYDKNVSVCKNMKKKAKRFLLPFVPYPIICKKLESLISAFKNVPTKNKALMTGVWHEPWVCPAEVFSSYVEVEFEGYKFTAFKGYDEYLRCQYGDYMQLPPIEEQIPKHDYKVYWKNHKSF